MICNKIPKRYPNKTETVMHLLREKLANGEPQDATCLMEELRSAGYSTGSIERATKQMGIIKTKIGFLPSRWVWELRK